VAAMSPGWSLQAWAKSICESIWKHILF
jgi:hypothetical protein